MKRFKTPLAIFGAIALMLVLAGAVGKGTNVLGTNDADNAYNSDTVAANADGSVLERQEYIQTELAKVPKSDSTVSFNATALAAIEGEAQDAIQAEQLDHLNGVSTEVAADADLTTYAADLSLMSHVMTKGADTSDYAASTDSLEALSDKAGGFSGDGGADQDDSIMASLDLAHTDLDAILAKTPANMAYTAAVTSSADTTHSVYSSLTGYGDGYFVSGWTMIVIWDAGGANAAPEGEVVDITGYTSSSGAFVHGATTQLAATDVVLFVRDELVSMYQKALPASPVSNSLAYRLSTFLASGDGDFAGSTALASNKSLVDSLGQNGADTAVTPDRNAAALQERIDAITTVMQMVDPAAANGWEDDGSGGNLYSTFNSTDANGNLFSGDGGTDYDDNLFSFLVTLSKYVADGDGDFATGSTLPSNKSIYDITGAYTADGGADDEDTIMAHLDLIYSDSANIDAMQPQSISKAITTIANGNNDLFVVAGGPIKLLEIVAFVTTTIGSESIDIYYNIDPTVPAGDTTFGSDGDGLVIDGDAEGTIYTWDGVIANDLIATTNGVALGVSAAGSSGLIIPAGSIELTAVHDGTCDGAITVYMRYIPLVSGVTVTAAS